MTNIGFVYNRRYFKKDVFNSFCAWLDDNKNKVGTIDWEIPPYSTDKKKEDINITGSLPLYAETLYPGMLIGIGLGHEISAGSEHKLGLTFDHTSGLPVIPGSTVKGVLRSMFPGMYKGSDKSSREAYIKEKLTTVKNINITDLEASIFDGVKNKFENLSVYERDIFYDATLFAVPDKLLGVDFITPHENPLKNPIPIQFLKVMGGVVFQFNFKLNDSTFYIGESEIKFSGEEKLQLFKSILEDIGIGAKTNVGYGQLKFINKEVAEKRKEEFKLQQKTQSVKKRPLVLIKKSDMNKKNKK